MSAEKLFVLIFLPMVVGLLIMLARLAWLLMRVAWTGLPHCSGSCEGARKPCDCETGRRK